LKGLRAFLLAHSRAFCSHSRAIVNCSPRAFSRSRCVQHPVPPTGQLGCVQKIWVRQTQSRQLANLGVSKRFGCVKPSPANWPTWVCPKDLGASNPVPPTGQLGCVQNRRNVPKNVAGAARPLAGPRPVCWTKQHPTPRRILRTGEHPGQPEPTSAGRAPKSLAPTGE
jgi:hypothetical protein